MSTPTLDNTVKRTFDTLRQGAAKQVTDYEQRFSAIKDLYDDLLSDLTVTKFSREEALHTAKEFFGSEAVRFAAVDGTMYSRLMFDLVIFFGGAYAATGIVKFTEESPKVCYDSRMVQQNMGISSVVPMYVNEIPDVDHKFASQEQPREQNPSNPQTGEGIANNSLIANVIMTFSEYYLAFKLAADLEQATRIILMDRSLSTERASLLYETRKTSFWRAKTALAGYQPAGEDVEVDSVDLVIGRQHVYYSALGLPAPRADHLRSAVIAALEQEKALTTTQIAAKLGISDDRRRARLEKALKWLTQSHVLVAADSAYYLNPRYTASWARLKKLTMEIGDRLFFVKTTSETSSSMKILKNGTEQWLTTLDISFLTLFTMQMLMEECWKKRILLVGVTKDTAASDFKRQLVPIMATESLLKTQPDLDGLSRLPNTDRMILQSASMLNPKKVVPPWSLIEYDSAFRSMQADGQNRKGYVSGVIRNKISVEKAFLKTYVQLSQAKSDPMLRSNVLLIDRLAYPDYDLKLETTVRFWNELSEGTKEPVDVLLYKDNSVPNELQNLVMIMLVAMTPANIPEAFGHNKPLFVADKIAKWNYNQFRAVVDSTASWMLNNHKLRSFIFYMSTFRERRSQIEETRRNHN